MKTITIPVYFDGEDEYLPMLPAKLALYPDANRHTAEVKYEPLRGRTLQDVAGSLNRRPELFLQNQFDGKLTPGLSEGLNEARAEEVIKRTVKSWRFLTASGDCARSLGEINDDALASVAPSLIFEVASRIESPVIPPPPKSEAKTDVKSEEEEAPNDSPDSTKNT